MSDLNNGNILLLDDDAFLVKIYNGKFIQAGCNFQSAYTVDDALRILHRGFVPHVVIFDIEMKGKDGFNFLQAIRDQKLAQGAYIIALTNHSGLEDRQHAEALGTDKYIVKEEMIPKKAVPARPLAVKKK